MRAAIRVRWSPRRWVLTGAVVVLVLAVGAATGWLVGFSSVLDVRSVEVHRPVRGLLSAESVLAAAQVPTGTPMARVDLRAVSDRVARLPEVAEVTVTRDWPHTVTVAVTERTAVYALRQPSGYSLVDAAGVAFHRVERAPSGLTEVVADGADRELLTGLAQVVQALPRSIRADLLRMEAPTRDQVTLVLNSGVRVIWGSPSDSELKAQVAVVLLGMSQVSTVDVSAPSHPTTR